MTSRLSSTCSSGVGALALVVLSGPSIKIRARTGIKNGRFNIVLPVYDSALVRQGHGPCRTIAYALVNIVLCVVNVEFACGGDQGFVLDDVFQFQCFVVDNHDGG